MNSASTTARRTADAIVRVSEADWVEATKMATVMRGVSTSQWAALAVVAVLTMLSWPHAIRAVLYAVLGTSLAVAVVRYRVSRGFLRLAREGQIDHQLAYLHRHRWFWPLNAISWGVWPLVFHGRLLPESEVVCWMLTAGVGGVAVAWMSAHLQVTRVFLWTFLACVAASVGTIIVVWPEHMTQGRDFWFPAVLGVYWLMLLRMARQLHELYRESIDLSYHNARLIHSLREQKGLAEEASRKGWIVFKRVGVVIEVLFPNLINQEEKEWLRGQN